jgi:CheY-like chemotaxis protein
MKGKPKVLLVTTDAALGPLVQETLEIDYGFEAQIARSGQDVLALIDQDQPDAILLSLEHPDIGGHQLSLKIKSIKRDKPLLVFAWTGYANDSLISGSWNPEGFDRVFGKSDVDLAAQYLQSILGFLRG